MYQAKIIEHKKYTGSNTCISLAHFAAEQANRQAVNAQWLWEHPDATGYLYSKQSDEYGLDPWTVINGVDATPGCIKIILETGVVGEREVHPDYEVFVHKKHIESN